MRFNLGRGSVKENDMNGQVDFFQKMCKEAEDEVASGEKGWRELAPNVLILACFAMLTNHLSHKLTRPLWFFAGTIFTGVVGYLIHLFLG